MEEKIQTQQRNGKGLFIASTIICIAPHYMRSFVSRH